AVSAHPSVTGYSIRYDGNAYTAVATATDVNGNPLPASDFNLTATVHTNAGTSTDAWTFHDPSGNYLDASGTVDDSVAQATLTVTADAKTKTQGQANPALTASYNGFVPGETFATSGVSGSPALVTSADPSSPEGAYAITVGLGTLAAANYQF